VTRRPVYLMVVDKGYSYEVDDDDDPNEEAAGTYC
jgi:hypothetical protein